MQYYFICFLLFLSSTKPVELKLTQQEHIQLFKSDSEDILTVKKNKQNKNKKKNSLK